MFSSCQKGGEEVFLFNIEREFNIPTSLNTIETHFFQLKNVPTFFEQRLTQYGLTSERVSTINPGNGFLTAKFKDVDWTFVREVEIDVVSRVDNNNRAQVFYIRSPDYNDRSKVGMFNTFADVSEILLEDTVDLEVRIKIISFVPGNIIGVLNLEFAVFEE